jgi:uncharacterized protein YciI
MAVELDRFTIALLILRPDAPDLDKDAAARLQDAHMDHLARLHEAGHVLAAGPLFEGELRGLTILNVDVERARALTGEDPAVKAGRFSVRLTPWMVPRGAISFTPARFPHSTAEVAG